MKIIHHGDERFDRWWAGLRICCIVCNAEVELEAADETSMYAQTNQLPDRFGMNCLNCGKLNFVENPLFVKTGRAEA